MSLTITEKNHWKERIEGKIDRKIERLEASDPDLFRDVKKAAREKVLNDRDVVSDYRDLVSLDEKINQLEAELTKIADDLYEQLSGEKMRWGKPSLDSVDGALDKQSKHFEEDLLKEHNLGAEILKLREEKESLLDTVWLATSNRQIKDLWTQVSELLGEQPTDLQKQAIDNDIDVGGESNE